MKLWACIRTETLFENAEKAGWFDQMRACGIEGFLVKSFDVTSHIPPERAARAKKLLDAEGFEMMALGLALGHPVGLDTPHYAYHEGWHIRQNVNGETVRWCSAITPRLISDIRAHLEELASLGIHTMFWDDDLRQGNYEGDVQGCFCDDCLKEFAEKNSHVIPQNFSRETMARVVPKDPAGLTEAELALREAWMDFNSDRIVAFLKGTNFEGMRSGIMVMRSGDRRHGIDLAKIAREIPDCLFRVGEHLFRDEHFEAPGAKTKLVKAILGHMALMGDPSNIFSESTVYPHGALTPENLKKKIVIERKCGLENINLMGIERMNHPDYYTMLQENLAYFRSLTPTFTEENAHLAEEI